jgi:hypothetical protein
VLVYVLDWGVQVDVKAVSIDMPLKIFPYLATIRRTESRSFLALMMRTIFAQSLRRICSKIITSHTMYDPIIHLTAMEKRLHRRLLGSEAQRRMLLSSRFR